VIPDTEIRDMNCIIDDYKHVRVNEGKAKFPQCRECRYDNMCEGPWKEYPERFGSSEFIPLKRGVGV